jgi:hypothetical protein
MIKCSCKITAIIIHVGVSHISSLMYFEVASNIIYLLVSHDKEQGSIGVVHLNYITGISNTFKLPWVNLNIAYCSFSGSSGNSVLEKQYARE